MNVKSLLAAVLLLLSVSAAPATAQEFETKAEYDAYLALYNETNLGQKVILGETFVAEYPDSEAAPIAYQILVATYFSERKWQEVLEVTDRFEAAFPDANEDTQTFVYRRAMASAQQAGNPEGIIRYGEHILALDRNDLGALLTLPPVILDNLPEFGSGTERGLGRAFELANRARLRAQAAYPGGGDDPQRNTERQRVFSSIHMALGTVHFRRRDYDRAIREYETVLSYDNRNPLAYLEIGLSRQFQASQTSQLLQQAAGNSLTEADALPPEVEALREELIAATELAMDSLAKAAALGGPAADQARGELEKIFRNRNEGSVEGLDDLIRLKREELLATPAENL